MGGRNGRLASPGLGPMMMERWVSDLPEHLDDLCVLLALLLEGEFSLLIVVLVLSTSSVLASLSLVLRHLVSLARQFLSTGSGMVCTLFLVCGQGSGWTAGRVALAVVKCRKKE